MLKNILNLYKRPVTIRNILLAMVLDVLVGVVSGILLSIIFKSPAGGSVGASITALLIFLTITYFFTLRVIDSFKRK